MHNMIFFGKNKLKYKINSDTEFVIERFNVGNVV